MRKHKVLFVGGFSAPADGTIGGQIFACRSLVASPLSEQVDWILVDSSQDSNPPPSLPKRAWAALSRVFIVLRHICFSNVDSVLVFSSFEPFSLLEKGLYCFMGNAFQKQTVLSIRSHPLLPRHLRKFIQVYGYLVGRASDYIICQSQLAADDLAKSFGVDSSKIRVVSNWIDTSVFRPGVKSDLGQECQSADLIYVGGLHPLKGVEYLLQAIKLLESFEQSYHLRICGSGPMEHQLVKLAEELGIKTNVTFMGWVPNSRIRDLLIASDVFVFPSLQEGMPNAILQAMACGLPVVSTNISSIPALVEDGVNGILVPPRNPLAFCEALMRLIQDCSLQKQMGSTNRNKIERCHSLPQVWPQVSELLGVTN